MDRHDPALCDSLLRVDPRSMYITGRYVQCEYDNSIVFARFDFFFAGKNVNAIF